MATTVSNGLDTFVAFENW